MVGWIIAIVIGIVAGYLAGQIMKGRSLGLILNLIVGLVGGVLGNWIFSLFGFHTSSWIGSLICAVIGAVVLLYVISLFTKKK